MEEKKGKVAPTTTNHLTHGANVHNPNDLYKVLEYFRYTVGTTLDCFFATGVLRNCITWYVRDLENMGLLQAIYIARDRRTRFKAKHYSADPQKWQRKPQDTQFNLFTEG